ncbi:ubiquitin carboxyl-terminal hydrolase, family 1 [Purpureocillium lilacinum]|uniref:Ubiquitin carboxyl-terminal hydrolase n=1 Tax=Purpureocillium lilacinum TaxID=33203 RepID=A0A2U3EDC1_PURLI|nr:ubiquitin carboxyl-terminal hydrolase, family 1 [Purpureocillium lilacinum]
MAPEPRADSGASAENNTAGKFWESPEAIQDITNRAAEKALDKIADRIADEVAGEVPREFITEVADAVRETLGLCFASFGADKTIPATAVEISDDSADEAGDEAADEEEEEEENKAEDEAEDEVADRASDEAAGVAASEINNNNNPEHSSKTSPEENGSHPASPRQTTPPEAAPAQTRLKRQSPDREEEEPEYPNKRARAMSDPETRRRNPKRKATETREPSREIVLPENPLEEALRPLTDDEKAEWEGWAEVESEPAMFNIILAKLGVPNVRAKELFTCENWDLSYLPQPVLGLVFLFKYAPDLEDDSDGDDKDGKDLDGVWFANQTTANSCASVALLNIIMNAQNINLGTELQNFKASTQGLESALRGHRIGSNDFIRTAHNSFVRRIEQLNADLFLANEADTAAKAKARAPRKRTVKAAKQEQADVEYGYHFIAYLHAAGHVWELDGMRPKPRDLGTCDADMWTHVAGPRIEERMEQYGANQIAFNLLAICQTPVAEARTSLESAFAEMKYLATQMNDDGAFLTRASKVDEKHGFATGIDVSEFELSDPDVDHTTLSAARKAQLCPPGVDVDTALKTYDDLVGALSSAMFTYRQECSDRVEEMKVVEERTRDYSLGVKLWLTKLAEKGLLEELVKESSE